MNDTHVLHPKQICFYHQCAIRREGSLFPRAFVKRLQLFFSAVISRGSVAVDLHRMKMPAERNEKRNRIGILLVFRVQTVGLFMPELQPLG